MSVPLGLAALDVLVALVGAAFLALVGVADSLGVGVRLLGLSYLTGWALLGVTLSLGLTVGLPLTVPGVALVAMALVVICALGARRGLFDRLGRRPHVAPSRFDRWISWLGAALLCLGGAALLTMSVKDSWNPASDFDAFVFWLPKAESIYVSHGLDASLWRQFVHMEYPPLFPAVDASTFAFVGGFHPSLLPFQQALLGLAFVVGVLGLLDRVAPRWLSVPVLALIATAPWFWDRLTSVMPDQTVAYMIAGAALASVLWLLEPQPAWLALAAVFLAAGTLTKLEGWLSALFLAGVVIVASLVHYRRRGLAAAWLLLGPATIVVWRIWLHANGLPGSSPDYSLSNLFDPSYLDHRTARLRYSLNAMTRTGGDMLAGLTPATRTQFSTHVEAAVLGAGLVVLLVFAARSSLTVAATVGCWFVLALVGLEAIYWIGRIPVKAYVGETVDRVEETPALVMLTLLPLLLALALRLVPTAGANRAESQTGAGSGSAGIEASS